MPELPQDVTTADKESFERLKEQVRANPDDRDSKRRLNEEAIRISDIRGARRAAEIEAGVRSVKPAEVLED